MSKEEFLNIQTCVLKVNIHCDGCKHKVKKILHKIEGVYTTKIDSEQGKVTVSGNVDSATLIKKLTKNGKHAQIWGAPKPHNNKDQLKNLQIEKAGDKNSNNNKDQGQKGNPTGNNQPKGPGGPPPHGLTPHQLQQFQHLQQMKGFQDLKVPPQFMKDMKMMPQFGGANNINKGQMPNQKPGGGAKPPLVLPEDEGMSDDDDYDDDESDDEDDYDEDEDEDDYDDELDGPPMNKASMKPPEMGNGLGPQIPNMLMKGPQMPGNGGKGAKNIPVLMNLGGGGGSGKKGDNVTGNNGGNQNLGSENGGKARGGQPAGKTGSGGGNGGQNKYGGGGGAATNIHNIMANGAKKGGGMTGGPQGIPNMMMAMNGGGAGGGGGQMGNMMPMGHNQPMGQMGNQATIQGMPRMNGGGLGGPNMPEHMAGNPYHQQQIAAMMMNQQRANGNERFHPMMYARPPPAVNYMQPYPPYPYPPPPGERVDQYSMFSDENTSSCSVM